MNTVGERIAAERLAWRLSQTELARRAGVKRQSNISNLETGLRKRGSLIPAIAAALNLNALWLLEGRGPKYADEALARRMGFLAPGADSDRAPYEVPRFEERETQLIPVINQTEIEMYRELIQHPTQAARTLLMAGADDLPGAAFAMRMEDDSMAGGPRPLPAGWYALVDADRTPDLGDLVVVRLDDGRAYCREYVADAGARLLKPTNPQYSSRPAPTDPGAYLGVVIGRHFNETWE